MERVFVQSDVDRYVIVEYIAEGGMGAIFLGKKIGMGGFEKEVVLKQLLPEFTAQKEFIDLFLREASLSATLDHANIVHTIDLVTAGNDYFIVMEYIRGGDLRTILKRIKHRDFFLEPAAAFFITREVLSALAYAHEKKGNDGQALNLIHRDISPSNIMISAAGEVKLTDFGIAKVSTHQSVFYRVKGKVGYMSPEQAYGKVALDRRSDLYSLAVCFYEMLTGERLFVADLLSTPGQIYSQPIPPLEGRPGIPAGLDALMARALAFDREERFQTAIEFQDALIRVAYDSAMLFTAPDLSSHLKAICGENPAHWSKEESEEEAKSGPEPNTQLIPENHTRMTGMALTSIFTGMLNPASLNSAPGTDEGDDVLEQQPTRHMRVSLDNLAFEPTRLLGEEDVEKNPPRRSISVSGSVEGGESGKTRSLNSPFDSSTQSGEIMDPGPTATKWRLDNAAIPEMPTETGDLPQMDPPDLEGEEEDDLRNRRLTSKLKPTPTESSEEEHLSAPRHHGRDNAHAPRERSIRQAERERSSRGGSFSREHYDHSSQPRGSAWKSQTNPTQQANVSKRTLIALFVLLFLICVGIIVLISLPGTELIDQTNVSSSSSLVVPSSSLQAAAPTTPLSPTTNVPGASAPDVAPHSLPSTVETKEEPAPTEKTASPADESTPTTPPQVGDNSLAPPAAEGAEQTRSLKVESQPTNAKVFLNNIYQCLTPCTIEQLEEEQIYILSVRAKNYRNWSSLVDVRNRRDLQVTASLATSQRRTDNLGYILVHSPLKANIFVDGIQIGHVSTEGKLPLPRGQHDIVLSHPRKIKKPRFMVEINPRQIVHLYPKF